MLEEYIMSVGGRGTTDEEILARHKFSGAGTFNTGGAGTGDYKPKEEFTAPKEPAYYVKSVPGAGDMRDKIKFTGVETSGAPGFGEDMEAFRKDAKERWQRFSEKLFKEVQDEVIKNFEYPDVRNVRIYYDLTKASNFALGLEAGGIKNISIVKVEDHWEVRYV